MTVKLYNSAGTLVASATTDKNGAYSFTKLAADTYSVSFTTPSGYSPTTSNAGSDDKKDSDPVNGTVTGIVLSGSISNTTVDAGYVANVLAIGNKVWYDTNNDGKMGSAENGIVGATVNLYKDDNNDNVADGAAIATTVTDANGAYAFTKLAAGNYIAGVAVAPGYMSSTVNGGDPDNNTDSDDNGQVLSGTEIRGLTITLSTGAESDGSSTKSNTNNTYDFGLLPDCNCINTAGNLLSNASFENGTAGWTTSGGTLTTGTGYTSCGSKNGFNTSSGKTSLVYQDVTVAAGSTVVFTGFAGTHKAGLTCSPKLSLIFRNASGTVLLQKDVTVNNNVDLSFGQLAYYTITATAPAGTAKVRVQSSITCNYMKLDALCLRTATATSSTRTAGTVEATAVESLQPEIIPQGFNVAVSPNPSNGLFNLLVQSDDNNSPVNLKIYSIDGKLVAVKKTGANSMLKIDGEGWKNGMYLFEIIQGDRRKIVKVIKAD